MITRQEVVSMIPPFVLNPQPGDIVLDLCAAPGSKTCQTLEIMVFNNNHKRVEGAVVANDVEHKRCKMLSHQLQRLNYHHYIVTQYDARTFPM